MGEDKYGAAIYVTVVGATVFSQRALTVKDAATKCEEAKVSEFATRVSDVNSPRLRRLLRLDNAPAWMSPFKFSPFGLESHGALGNEVLTIFQQFVEKRADRSLMFVGM